MLRRISYKKKEQPREGKAQSTIEFTFSMIVVCIMMYSLARVFYWTGKDTVERRMHHENMLRLPGRGREHVKNQLTTNFHLPASMNAGWSYGRW